MPIPPNKPAGRKPDFNLVVYDKHTGRKGTVGAAWFGDTGEVRITLPPGITLSQPEGISLILWPTDDRPVKPVPGGKPALKIKGGDPTAEWDAKFGEKPGPFGEELPEF